MTLSELIAALEAADGPGLDLDEAIKTGLSREGVWVPLGLPPYTVSLDAALTLVPEGCGFTLNVNRDTSEAEVFGEETGTSPWVIVHPARRTPALALCIAALKAREAKG